MDAPVGRRVPQDRVTSASPNSALKSLLADHRLQSTISAFSLSTVIASLSVLETPGAADTCLFQPVPTVKSSQGLYQVGARHRHVANILSAGTVSAKDSPVSAQTPAKEGNSLVCPAKPNIWARRAAKSLSLCG